MKLPQDRLTLAAMLALAFAAGFAFGAVLVAKSGLQLSDVISIMGNIVSVLAAVILALKVEQRQRHGRVSEIRKFLIGSISNIAQIVKEWDDVRLKAKGSGRDNADIAREQLAIYDRFMDEIAVLSAARSITSVENLAEIRAAQRILNIVDRGEHWVDFIDSHRNLPGQLLSPFYHLMHWDRGGDVLRILREEGWS